MKNVNLVLILTAVSLSNVSCATTPSKRALEVQEIDYSGSAKCKFLKTLTGTSGWGALAAKTGIQNSKNEVLDEAASLGATHILWESADGAYASTAVGKAYICPK